MPAEGRENPLLKKGNFDAFFREKYLTKNTFMGLLVVVLFEEDPPVLVQLFQCPDLMRFCFPQIGICNLMEFFTFAF